MWCALIVAAVSLTYFFGQWILYRRLLFGFGPQRYEQLKATGKFGDLPDTFEELVLKSITPPDELETLLVQHRMLEDPRVNYGRFIDTYLVPGAFIWAKLIGVVSLVVGIVSILAACALAVAR
jgi:hypothetical protein